MAFTKEKETAIAMRKEGRSLGEIVTKTGMKKSTVSVWCRSISLSPAQRQRLADKQLRRGRIGLIRAAEIKRVSRLESIAIQKKIGAHDVAEMNRRDLLLLGIGLYWGEGYKNLDGEFGFTNSDPRIIMTFIKWLEDGYGIKKSDLILRVSINQIHKEKAVKIRRFWSATTGIPISQFTQTSVILAQTRKIFTNNKTYTGTLRVKVRRGVSLLRRVLGSIEQITTEIGANR